MTLRLLKESRKLTDAGYLRKFVRKGEAECNGFEEVYFSRIRSGIQRGWYRNNKSVSILMVVCGQVEFLVKESCESNEVDRVVLSENDDILVVVDKGHWYAFKGLSRDDALICNALQYVFHAHDTERLSFTGTDKMNVKDTELRAWQ